MPPFPFEGVSARVFPLRARIDVLRRFCDSYLNIIPPELGRFRPAAPYVYMLLLNYGRMAVQLENVGWFAQREVVFNVPVEWYRRVRGRWVFQDWALVSPFIFVNHDIGLTMGRTVFGWPKTTARLQESAGAWADDPTAPFRQAVLSTTVFPELYHKERLREETFLEIELDASATTFHWPPDPRTPFAPWTVAANLSRSLGGLARDYVGFLEALGVVPLHWGSDATNHLGRIGRAGEWMYPLGRDRAANTLNLKQFRSSGQPENYCFQALTNGPMRFTAVHRGGFLGPQQMMLGDLSGGYSLRVHRWPSLPIVETLGLEARSTRQGPGCRISELEPVAPYWFEADMEYLQGYNVAWRAEDTVWRDRYGRRYPNGDGCKAPRPADRRFNTTLGSYNKALVGPFQYTGTKLRVLPLLARRRRLEKLIDRYMNQALEGTGHRFRLWASTPLAPPPSSAAGAGGPGPTPERPATPGTPGASEPLVPPPLQPLASEQERPTAPGPSGGDAPPRRADCPPADPATEPRIPRTPYAYVYMAVTAYGKVESSTNNVGDWASLEVAFLVPVLRERFNQQSCQWEVCGVGALPVAVYVDDVAAVGAGAEVLGLPALQAKFGRPKVIWLTDDPAEANAPQQLLRVGAQTLPAFGEGQEARMRTVIEVTRGNFLHTISRSQRPMQAARWAERMIAELERMDATAKAHAARPFNRARALSLEVLCSRESVSYFTLKQLRDIEQPDMACYQSLVGIGRTFTEIHEVKEIEEDLIVTIHETASHPLVSTLGLIGINVEGRGAGLAYALQPIRPFEMSVDMMEDLGRRIVHRSGGGPWQHASGAAGQSGKEGYFCAGEPICIELQLPRPLNLGAVECLGSTERIRSDQKFVTFSRPKAKEAVEHIDPQMVIESLLAREWGATNPKWMEEKRRLEKWLAEGVTSNSPMVTASQELQLIEARVQELRSRHGASRMKISVSKATRERYAQLAEDLAKVEWRWNRVVTRFEGLDSEGNPGIGWERFGLDTDLIDAQFDDIAAIQALLEDLDAAIEGAPSGLVPADIQARIARLKRHTSRLASRFLH